MSKNIYIFVFSIKKRYTMEIIEGLNKSEREEVSTIVDTYSLLSPLGETESRIIREILIGSEITKTYIFRSMYDRVEVSVHTKDLVAFNLDGDIIEGKYTAYDSAIGTTRLFSTWTKASEFANKRKASQKYLNKVVGG